MQRSLRLNPWLMRRLNDLVVRPVIVEFEPDAFLRIAGEIAGQGLTIRNRISRFNMAGVVAVPAKLIPVIASLPGVRLVSADLTSHAFQLPGVGDQSLWWPTAESRRVLEAQIAVQQGFTGEQVRMAVIDTGIDPSHEQLRGSDFTSTIRFPLPEIADENGHGSHCASTAAGRLARSPVDVTVDGVSHARLVSIKCLGRGVGTGFTSEIVAALAEAQERGAQVVNMSLGSQECQGGCEVCPECRAVKSLSDSGALVFVAAGNSGPDPNTISCPGCSPAAITVAAVNRDGKAADFSSRGGDRFPSKPDIAAPGVDIYSGTARLSFVDAGDADAGPGYAAISGTSMATPHTAGLGALLKARMPGIDRAQFMAVVRAAGGRHNTITGYGVPRWSWFTSGAVAPAAAGNGAAQATGINRLLRYRRP